MNIIKSLVIAAGIAGLAACAGESEQNDAANLDVNMTDLNAGMDMNAGMDGNMTINTTDGMNATENAVVNDLTTNDADTNLANGM